jgi:peptide/nickel transport system substrate-binding protein
MKKLLTALLIVSMLTTLFGVIASADGKQPAAAAARKDSIVIGTTGMNGQFNPLYAESAYDIYANELMFDTLANSTADGKPTTQAAFYKVSADGLTYTFILNDKLKFWDGKDATAKDVEFTFDLMADPSYDGVLDLTPCGIVGYDAYHSGKATTISGIKVVNNSTITVQLAKSFAPALWYLNIPVLEKAYYASDFKKGNTDSVKKLIGKPMGSGQYKFDSFDPTTGLKLTANKNYFLGAPKIKTAQFVVVPQGKELDSVISGAVDFANATCNAANVAKAKDSGYVTPNYFPTNGYGVIHWNTSDPFLSDVKVRQALAYGLDRQTVVSKVYGAYGKVNDVPIPMGSWGYTTDGITSYNFNMNKARQLLNEAGWTIDPSTNQLTKNGKNFVINFTATPGNPVTDVMLPVMKDNYAKLGITVNIQSADFATMLKGLSAGTLQACFMGSGLTVPDPDQYGTFNSKGTQNYFKYTNAELDKLIDQELSQTNTKDRLATFKKINQILNAELPVFTVYQRNDLWTINSRIGNVPKLGAYRDPFNDFYKYTIK